MSTLATQTETADRATYPFKQGLHRDVALRLLSGTFTPAEYAAYLRTPHWTAKKAEAFETWGCACGLCDAPAAQVHHRPSGYRHLFREDVRRHLIPLCRLCHKRHHRR